MEELFEKYQRLMEFAPEQEVDEYSTKQLKKRIYGWHNAEREYLINLEYFINGKGYSSIINGIYKEPELKKLKIRFLKPDLKGKWAFTKPPKELMEKGGKGVYRCFAYDPMRLNGWSGTNKVNNEIVMVRGYLTNFFVPMSIKSKSRYHHAEEIPRMYEPQLKKISSLWEDMRAGILPFGIRLCLYTPIERFSIIIDPLTDKLLPHPLCKAPYHSRVKHTAIEYMIFDTVLANINMPKLSKKIFEFVFECGETTAPDVAHVFNIQTKIAENNLQSLRNRELVRKKREYHYIDMDDIRRQAENKNKWKGNINTHAHA